MRRKLRKPQGLRRPIRLRPALRAAVLILATLGRAKAGVLSDDGLQVSTWVNYFSSDRSLDNRTGVYGTGADLLWHRRLDEGWRLHAHGRWAYPTTGSASPVGRVLSAYAERRTASDAWRIGTQTVAWGQADGVNPTDNLTPSDYTVLRPATADQRFGIPAILWHHYLSRRYTWTTFITPYFSPSVLPLPATAGVPVVQCVPSTRLAHTETAFKLSRSGDSADWSLSYFRGFDLLPDVRLASTVAPEVLLHYDAMTVWGADIDIPYGRFVFWAETGYVHPTAFQHSADPAPLTPALATVLGVSHALGRATLRVQMIERHVFHYNDPVYWNGTLAQALALDNALINGETHRDNSGVTAEVMDHWMHSRLQGHVFIYLSFRPNSRYTRLFLSYAVSDHLQALLGADLYEGPSNSEFCQLKPNQGWFLEGRYNL